MDSIYEHGRGLGFKPFYHKANDFQEHEQREFCEGVIRNHREQMAAFAHSQEFDGDVNLQQAEAVPSAIYVEDLFVDGTDPLIIVDGNEQQATPFIKALSGLRSDYPVVTHCHQSESYHPTALLADLAPNHLAHSIDAGRYDHTDPVLPAPFAKRPREDDWGWSFSAMCQNRGEYSPPELQSLDLWREGGWSIHQEHSAVLSPVAA